MKKMTLLLASCLVFMVSAQDTYIETAYSEEFNEGFEISNTYDNEASHNIVIDGQEEFVSWFQDHSDSDALDNNGWWKVQGSKEYLYVSCYQGADWSFCVFPKVDLSGLTSPTLQMWYSGSEGAAKIQDIVGLDPKVEIYFSQYYNGSEKFTSVPSDDIKLGEVTTATEDGDLSFDITSIAGKEGYIYFAYTSQDGTKASSEKMCFDNVLISEEKTLPAMDTVFFTDIKDSVLLKADNQVFNMGILKEATGLDFFSNAPTTVEKDTLVRTSTGVQDSVVTTVTKGGNWFVNYFHVTSMLDFTKIAAGGVELTDGSLVSWVVTPKMDMSNSNFASFSCNAAKKFGGPAISYVYSTDWDGVSDPSTQGTWNDLSVTNTPSANLSVWRPDGAPGDQTTDAANYKLVEAPLNDACGNASVYVAIKGTLTNLTAGGHYLIENVLVKAASETSNLLEAMVNTPMLEVYPNPASSTINIKNLPNNSLVKIYTLSGIEVYSNTVNQGNSIDVSQLKNGVYFINTGQNKYAKFIKR